MLCTLALTFSLAGNARNLSISGDSDEVIGDVGGDDIGDLGDGDLGSVDDSDLEDTGDVVDMTGHGGAGHGGVIVMGRVSICFARNRHDELFQGMGRNNRSAMNEAMNKCHQISRHCVPAACTRL